jgi:translocator protein
MRKKINFGRLCFCLILCVGGGWLSGLFTKHGLTEWYPGIVKSPLTPPDLVFPLTWTFLYVLMALSLYLVLSKPQKNKKWALSFFALQLFFNFAWSYIFFYLENPGVGLIDIACLWIAILVTLILFLRVSKLASYLLIPYLAWVSFAFYLNYFIWINN